MDVQEEKKGEVFVAKMEGRLDSVTSGQLEKILSSRLQAGEKNLLLDFSKVDYVSSAGLRVLLVAAKKANAAGGKVVLAGLASHVREIFDIAGFTSIFPIFTDQEEALASF